MISARIVISHKTYGDCAEQVREFPCRSDADDFVEFAQAISTNWLGGAWGYRIASYDAHANENGG